VPKAVAPPAMAAAGPRPVEAMPRGFDALQKLVGSTPRRAESGLEDIRLEISALRAAIGNHRDLGPQGPFVPGASSTTSVDFDSAVEQALCATGFEQATARQIASASMKAPGKRDDAILREIAGRIPVATFAPMQPDESRTLAFIGPSGRGKTTSLIKVAVKYGLANRIPTRIYMAGAHGVGAAEQMARYAAILGVPFQAVESYESLNLALSGERWKGLALIDTPGTVTGERHEMDAMAKFFSRRPEIERHLVIRAEARSADMLYSLTKFAAVQPSRFLFTGIDEVRGLGAAAETMMRSGIPAAFFGTGTQIPDDLEEVNVPKLARSLWAANGLAARAA
jgi:flagellar biosynthesis GTPase FlhF